jgi:hypothetical protein
VVFGKYKHLRLASEAAKRIRVEDAVPVTLKGGTELVGLFIANSISSSDTEGRSVGEPFSKALLSNLTSSFEEITSRSC